MANATIESTRDKEPLSDRTSAICLRNTMIVLVRMSVRGKPAKQCRFAIFNHWSAFKTFLSQSQENNADFYIFRSVEFSETPEGLNSLAASTT